MKINVLSDLHLGQGGLPQPANDADLVILAGDIARPQAALAWAAQRGKPTLYVAGNHEFYGDSLAATMRALKDASAGTCVRVLHDEEVVIDGRKKNVPKKIGLAPVQRDGIEYEFTCCLDIELESHMATASKDRTRLFASLALSRFCRTRTVRRDEELRGTRLAYALEYDGGRIGTIEDDK